MGIFESPSPPINPSPPRIPLPQESKEEDFIMNVPLPNKEVGIIMNTSNQIFNILMGLGEKESFYEKLCFNLNGSISTLIDMDEKKQFYDFNEYLISSVESLSSIKLHKSANREITNFYDSFFGIRKSLIKYNNISSINSCLITKMLSDFRNIIVRNFGPTPLHFQDNKIGNIIYKSASLGIELENILESIIQRKEDIKNRYVIIISDGTSEIKLENVNYLKRKAELNNIIILTLLLTNHRRERKFYDKSPEQYGKNIEKLFDVTSKVNYKNAFASYFIKKGWSFPEDGQGTLLFETDLDELQNSFPKDFNYITTFEGINIKIKQLTYDYLVQYKFNFISKNQIFGTCWSYAYSAAIFLTNKRILGRKTESFENIREALLKYGSEKNDDSGDIEDKNVYEFFKDKKINFSYINEHEAKNAVMEGNYVVCHFYLDEKQMKNFENFFWTNGTKTKILTKEIINEDCKINSDPKKKEEGHAVLFIEVGQGFLRFLNSWGPDFGDQGTFKIENADVLTSYTNNIEPEFFKIFINDSDITQEERLYFSKNKEYIKDLLNDFEDLSAKKIINKVKPLYQLKYKCQKCGSDLKIEQSYMKIEEGIDKIECPSCKSNNEGKGNLKKLLVMNNLLNDGNGEFDINFEEKYYVDIYRKKLYKKFEENNNFANESDSCSLGFLDKLRKRIVSPFDKEIKGINNLKDNIFVAHSSYMILIFELKGNEDEPFRILFKIKLYGGNISNLLPFGNNKIIISSEDKLKLFKFDYEKKELNLITIVKCYSIINQIIFLRNNELIAISDQNGDIFLYSLINHKDDFQISFIFHRKCHAFSISNMIYSPYEDALVTICEGDGALRFWKFDGTVLMIYKSFSTLCFRKINRCMLDILLKNEKGDSIGYLLIGAKDGIQVIRHKLNEKPVQHNYYKDKELGDIYSMRYLGNNYFICGRAFGFCSIFLLRENGNIRKINVFKNNNAWVYSRFDKIISDHFLISDICVKKIGHGKRGYIITASFDKTMKIYNYFINKIENTNNH